MCAVLWSWDIAWQSGDPAHCWSGRYAQMYLFVKHPQTILSLLLHQTRLSRSNSNICHVPLLWGRSLSLSYPRLLALLGKNAGVWFSWLLITQAQSLQRS